MKELKKGKLIIVSAPSGSGKTSIVKYLLENLPDLRFSVSATSRPPRNNEKEG
ncbi:MAG: guanylate kinase, partial [Bacteroidales bacterium]|nr:guanylate kinase [Bacteroidales bacterium]